MNEQEILEAARALRTEAREMFPEHRFLSVHISFAASAYDETHIHISVSGNATHELARAWDVASIADGVAEVRQKLSHHIKPSDAWAIIGAQEAA